MKTKQDNITSRFAEKFKDYAPSGNTPDAFQNETRKGEQAIKENLNKSGFGGRQHNNVKLLNELGVLDSLGLKLEDVAANKNGTASIQGYFSFFTQRIRFLMEDFMMPAEKAAGIFIRIFDKLELQDDRNVDLLFNRSKCCEWGAKKEIARIQDKETRHINKVAYLANFISARVMYPFRKKFADNTKDWVYKEAFNLPANINDVIGNEAADDMAKYANIVEENNPLINAEYKTTGFDEYLDNKGK